MKPRHIIAIGLLSALAVGLLAIGIKSGNKPKIQTKADNQITNLSNTNWQFTFTEPYQNHTYNNFQATYNITFTSNNTNYVQLKYTFLGTGTLQFINYVDTNNQNTTAYNFIQYGIQGTGWTNNNYKTINITTGTDATNSTLITLLQTLATNITPTTPTEYEEGYADGYIAGQQDGYDFGYATGYSAGQSTGYSNGYSAGMNAGQTIGYNNGYTAGQTAGYTNGYNQALEDMQSLIDDAYAEGYNDSEAFNHPIAVAPLMMQILTMPFTFISQAFDVTLWPGTEYQINIGNFIKALIAISAILFIIRLFTTGFSIIGNYTNNRQNTKLTKAKIQESKSRTALNNRTDPNNKTIKKD